MTNSSDNSQWAAQKTSTFKKARRTKQELKKQEEQKQELKKQEEQKQN